MGKSVPEATNKHAVKHKKSHKKSTLTEETPIAVSSTPTIQPDSDHPIENAEGVDDETKLEDRKARKKVLKAARKNVETSTEVTTEAAKGKKRKNDSEEGGATEKPAKKRRKNRTGFADPRDDKELNDQARRALEYAFMQMNKPEKWKFNKARQNWFVRNIWSPEAIPDTYFPLVVKYLSPVQGGPRERLTQTCESYLKVEANAGKDEKTGSSPAAAATTIPVPRSILKPTPGPLIDMSSSSEPIHAADAVIPQPPVPKTSIADIRRARAQSLLEALRSNDSNI